MDGEINTHNLIIPFGKHKGERWTRLPVDYLKWLSNEATMELPEGNVSDIAKAELKRRGADIESTMKLSAHALDRVSLAATPRAWEGKGIYTWLHGLAEEALASTEEEQPEQVEYKGFRFAFAYGNDFPTLKTVIRLKKNERPGQEN